MNLPELAKLLLNRRKVVGLSRAELARRLQVSDSYLWLIERGAEPRGGRTGRPSKGLLERWAVALGWDEQQTKHLLTLAGHSTPAPPPFALGSGALRFPQPKKVEDESIIEGVREVLSDASRKGESNHREAVELLKSFVEWLRFKSSTER